MAIAVKREVPTHNHSPEVRRTVPLETHRFNRTQADPPRRDADGAHNAVVWMGVNVNWRAGQYPLCDAGRWGGDDKAECQSTESNHVYPPDKSHRESLWHPGAGRQGHWSQRGLSAYSTTRSVLGMSIRRRRGAVSSADAATTTTPMTTAVISVPMER